MGFPLIPLIIQAATAIGQHILNRRAAKKESQYNASAQQAVNQQAFEQNKQMVMLQNRYNSPLAQMGRFAEAGLNPNLMYSQGNAGNQERAPTIDPPQIHREFSPMQIPDMIGTYQNFQAKQVAIDKAKTEMDFINQKIRTESVNRMNKLLHGETGRFNLDLAKELREYNVDIKANEASTSGLKAKMLAKEYALLDQFGVAERQSRLKSQALSQARQVVETSSAKERLELLKTFGWTQGYQQSAMNEQRILNAQEQAMFNKLKTELFRDHQMTPSDNFLVRMFMHFIMDNGMTPEVLGSGNKGQGEWFGGSKPYPPR